MTSSLSYREGCWRHPMKLDLHCHSVYSYGGVVGRKKSDSVISLDELAGFARGAGLDGLVLTDHMTMEAGKTDFEKMQRRNPDLVMLRGMEYHSDHSHLLLFGIKDDEVCRRFGKYGPAQKVIDFVNFQGGVVVPSHPYQVGYEHNMGDHVFSLSGLTALEVWNSCKSFQMNMRAVDAARKMNLPGTGGSDAHFPKKIGAGYTKFKSRITSMPELVNALKDGKYQAVRKVK